MTISAVTVLASFHTSAPPPVNNQCVDEGPIYSKPQCVHIKHNVTMITHTFGSFATAKCKIRNTQIQTLKYNLHKDPMCTHKTQSDHDYTQKLHHGKTTRNAKCKILLAPYLHIKPNMTMITHMFGSFATAKCKKLNT